MANHTSTSGTLFRLLGAIAGAGLVYALFIRPWHLTWGASEVEARFPFPGDDMLPNPKLKATHAVTINAPADRVWPWIVQMGQGRGGFYSYQWLENLMGLEMRNACEVQAAMQNLQEGDVMPLAPDGFGATVAVLDCDSDLVLFGDTRHDRLVPPPPGRNGYFKIVWGWHLREIDATTTRLIERWRAGWNDSPLNFLFMRVFMEPTAFLMERKNLLGIKERAEKSV